MKAGMSYDDSTIVKQPAAVALRSGHAGSHLHNGAGGCGVAPGGRRELRGRRAVPAMDAVVGDFADPASTPFLACRSGNRSAATIGRRCQFMAFQYGKKFYQFRVGHRAYPIGAHPGSVLCAQGGARYGGGTQPDGIGNRGDVSAVGADDRETDAGLQQWFRVCHDRHAGIAVELRGGHDPAGGRRAGGSRSHHQLLAEQASDAAGVLGAGIPERVGVVEACPSHGGLSVNGDEEEIHV